MYETLLENVDLNLAVVPDDPEKLRTMDASNFAAIEMPQVSRGQAHCNTLLSLAELSFTMNGDGFYRNGQVPNDQGKY